MTTAAHEKLHGKLQLRPGTTLWVWPPDEPVPPEFAETSDVSHGEVAEADVAILRACDRDAVDTVLSGHLADLARMRAVWIVYAKGNRTDVNRDTLWVQLAEYGWRAVSQVSVDAERSALRVRPLKPGEVPRTKDD